jgi:hypothetical protein
LSHDYQALYDKALALGLQLGHEGQIGGDKGRFAYFDTQAHPGTVIEISDISGTKGAVLREGPASGDELGWITAIRRLSRIVGPSLAAASDIVAFRARSFRTSCRVARHPRPASEGRRGSRCRNGGVNRRSREMAFMVA